MCKEGKQNNKRKEELAKELSKDISFHSSACSNNARHGVYAIMATALMLLISEENTNFSSQNSKITLALILLIGFIYLLIESIRYYATTLKARLLLKKIAKESYEAIDTKMQNHSDWAYNIWTIQLLISILLTIMMGCYLLLRFLL